MAGPQRDRSSEDVLVEDRQGPRQAAFPSYGLWILGGILIALTIFQSRFGLFGAGARGERTLIIVWAASIAALVFTAWRRKGRPRALPVRLIELTELPDLLATMALAPDEPVYAGLWFNTADQPDPEDAVNLNFSREDGNVGLDWILREGRNVRDRDLFLDFARTRGFEPKAQSKNGVSYLRVEAGDILALAAGLVTELYGVPPAQPMKMVCEGFDWPAA